MLWCRVDLVSVFRPQSTQPQQQQEQEKERARHRVSTQQTKDFSLAFLYWRPLEWMNQWQLQEISELVFATCNIGVRLTRALLTWTHCHSRVCNCDRGVTLSLSHTHTVTSQCISLDHFNFISLHKQTHTYSFSYIWFTLPPFCIRAKEREKRE